MNIAVLDLETSMKPILNPWQIGSFLSTIGLQVYRDNGNHYYRDWVYQHTEQTVTEQDQLEILFALQEELDRADLIVGHNIKFDLNWIKSKNIIVDGKEIWDTMQVEFMLSGQDKEELPLSQQDLSNCCTRHGLPVKTDVVKTYWDAGVNTDKIPLRILLPYQKNDIEITGQLFKSQYRQAKAQPKLFTLMRERNYCLHAITDIELNGMPFHKERAEKWVEVFTTKLDVTNSELRSYFGHDDLNLDSGPELSAGLYGGKLKRVRHVPHVYTRNVTIKEPYKLTYKSGKRKGETVTKYRNRTLRELTCKKLKEEYEIPIKGVGFVPPDNSETSVEGVFQTNKDVLRNLKCTREGGTSAQVKRRCLELLVHRSKISKFCSTFVGSKEGTGIFYHIDNNIDGRPHPNYNQTIAATGRMTSSGDMNGQNASRSKEDEDGFTNPLKTTFIPSRPDGLVFVGDLSQLEWRVAAWLSQDPVAMKEIIEGIDCHADNAIKFFGDIKYRQDAKIMTFRLLYGGSAYAFWIDPKMPNFTKGKWDEIVRQYNIKYRVLCAWQERNIQQVPRDKGFLYSPTGRIYRIPMEPHKKYPNTMVYKDTCIKNYPVQGTATGDIVPLAMNLIYDRIMADPMKYVSSNWMGQVHDSVIFDTMPHEVKQLAFTTIQVFEELPVIISDMWDVDFNLPMTGECEWGPDYGTMTHSVKHEGGQWILKQK
jgi:DNA polymerase I-like protein with 3'-5' exonuclease and polymerase domains